MSVAAAVTETTLSATDRADFETKKREFDRRTPARLILELFDLSGVGRTEAARHLDVPPNMFTLWLNFANNRNGQQTPLAFGTATRLLDLVRPKLKPDLTLTKDQAAAILFKLMEADPSCRVAMERLRPSLRFNPDHEFKKVQAMVWMRSGALSKKHGITNPALFAEMGKARLRHAKEREEIAADIIEDSRRAGEDELDAVELTRRIDHEENRRDDLVDRHDEERDHSM